MVTGEGVAGRPEESWGPRRAQQARYPEAETVNRLQVFVEGEGRRPGLLPIPGTLSPGLASSASAALRGVRAARQASRAGSSGADTSGRSSRWEQGGGCGKKKARDPGGEVGPCPL